MSKPMVGIRFTQEEYEEIKCMSDAAGTNDMAAYCRDVIRRELKNRGTKSKSGASGTQPLLIPEGDETETHSGRNKNGLTNLSGMEDSSQNDDIASPCNQVDPESPSATEDRSSDWFALHLARLDRDCNKAQSRVDKLTANLDIVQGVFHKTAAESLKTTLDTQDKIQTVLDDTSESFHSSMEEMRTGMESLFKKMQLTFEQTTAGGLRLLRETIAALTGQTEKVQETGIALQEQQLQRYEKIAQEELQAFKKTQTLMRDDLNGTRNVIDETFKLTAEEFRSVLNPAVSVLKRFKVETLKLKRTIWLSAVFTMFAVSVPAGGWLVYKYEHEKFAAEMWQRNAQRINHYVMKNFYPGLDTEGQKKINEYYSLFDLTTPEEQKGTLE